MFPRTIPVLQSAVLQFRKALDDTGHWDDKLEAEFRESTKEPPPDSKDLLKGVLKEAKARHGLETYLSRLDSRAEESRAMFLGEVVVVDHIKVDAEVEQDVVVGSPRSPENNLLSRCPPREQLVPSNSTVLPDSGQVLRQD